MTNELRERETARVRERMAKARGELNQLMGIVARWTDTVRTDAEARQGVAAGEPLASDPELWNALDLATFVERARSALDDAEERFDFIEQERNRPRACGTCGATTDLEETIVITPADGTRRSTWRCTDIRACNDRRFPELAALLDRANEETE